MHQVEARHQEYKAMAESSNSQLQQAVKNFERQSKEVQAAREWVMERLRELDEKRQVKD